MSSIEWFYARDNKQFGPVSAAEMKRLADAGRLRPDDLVWREGLSQWALARSVRGLFEAEPQPSADAATVSPTADGLEFTQVSVQTIEPAKKLARRHPVDALLDSLRSDSAARTVEAISRICWRCGIYGLAAGIVLMLFFTATVAAKTGSPGPLLPGIVLASALAALQYAAGRCGPALDAINSEYSVRLRSTILPDCLAVLSLFAGLAALLGSITLATQSSAWSALAVGLAGFVVYTQLALVALNPATINLTAGGDAQTGFGRETVASIKFLLKSLLKVVPTIFGTGVLAGAVLAAVACWRLLVGGDVSAYAPSAADAAGGALIWSAAVPLVAYLLFLLVSLILDLWRAVLSLQDRTELPATRDRAEEKTAD